MSFILAPATITKLKTLDPGALRTIELTLPDFLPVGEKEHPIQDGMRPGAAFWAELLGKRSKERQKRLYTRSNCSISAQRHLETIVYDTHDEYGASLWQSEGPREGDTVGV